MNHFPFPHRAMDDGKSFSKAHAAQKKAETGNEWMNPLCAHRFLNFA
jgi:hypothetical protein